MRSVIVASALGLAALSAEHALAQEAHTQGDGVIVEVATGFPYETYEQWLESLKSRYAFDETAFRKTYPPEDFARYKREMHVPFDTYEEWIQAVRARYSGSGFSEAAFREKYSPQEFRRYREEVEYVSLKYISDGLRIAGYVLRPKRPAGERFPVIIYNRGGNREFGRIDFEALYGLCDFVSRGYVVVASQYRGCCGSEGEDEFGGADLNDVLILLPLIDSLPYADPSRIGMYGWSRGGMMTYLVLARTDRIAAAVIGAGPTDLSSSLQRRPEADELFSALIPGYAENPEARLRSRSALHWAEALHRETPILLLQGSADRRNDPADVLRMASRLYEMKHPFRLVFFEGGDHGLSQYEEEVQAAVLNWLDRYVRDAS
jgi:dipeptidyl aminopeptidase/acylaminoacyl peptidase